MPTYLIHGFRWQRYSIKAHIILNDLEDASTEWIMAPATSMSMLTSFYTLFDFIPPSAQPRISYELPSPTQQQQQREKQEAEERERILREQETQKSAPRTLRKRRSSAISLRAHWRQNKQPAEDESRTVKTPTNDLSPSTTAQTPPLLRTPGSVRSDRGPSAPELPSSPLPPIPKLPRFNDWSIVKLLEQYDPDDLSDAALSQPWAYVADHMVEVRLGASLLEEMARYEEKMRAVEKAGEPASQQTTQADWFTRLRDSLQAGGDIGWFVVVCGDEDRDFPEPDPDDSDFDDEDKSAISATGDEDSGERTSTRSRRSGLKALFGRKKSHHHSPSLQPTQT